MTDSSNPIAAWLDPAGCPASPPRLQDMQAQTQAVHGGIDAHARATGVANLHPSASTVQLDLLGSAQVIDWQEGKAAFLFESEGCWAELPHLYARYGCEDGRALIRRVRELEGAKAALLTDCGMQAVALVADVLLPPGGHVLCMRQVYNKSRTFLEKLTTRLGGDCSVLDDGDWPALDAALRPESALLFCETFTNPLLRAQDVPRLVAWVKAARKVAPNLKLVVDSTIATPWSLRTPLLAQGVDVVVASGTKALGGQDADLWGLIATDHTDIANAIMDLQALRGGGLDGGRARSVLAGWDENQPRFLRRCASARQIAGFLWQHPRVAQVWHPSVPDHVDAVVIARDYVNHGSLLSFRVQDASESEHRHLADVLVMTVAVRYALSFDGLCTKVNHHATVSEYFTPPPALARLGCDRLVRLGVGLEAPEDLIACLNWALHHAAEVSPAQVAAWQAERRSALGLG